MNLNILSFNFFQRLDLNFHNHDSGAPSDTTGPNQTSSQAQWNYKLDVHYYHDITISLLYTDAKKRMHTFTLITWSIWSEQKTETRRKKRKIKKKMKDTKQQFIKLYTEVRKMQINKHHHHHLNIPLPRLTMGLKNVIQLKTEIEWLEWN